MRWWRVAIVALIIVAGAGFAPGRVPGAAAVGVWTKTANPPGELGLDAGHLTRLPDGRVLLTRLALFDQLPRALAGLYDPADGTWATPPAPDARIGFDAPVLLRDGRVLVSGGAIDTPGAPEEGHLAGGAQLYDPATNGWAQTGALVQARAAQTATVLDDSTVLIVGGQTGTRVGKHPGLASTERYDPATGKWAAGSLAGPRVGHTATLLRDGRVLVIGGQTGDDDAGQNRPVLTAERYDPASGRWSAVAAPLWTHGVGASATLLADGRVLVAGGNATGGGRPAALTVAEIYDPIKDSWTTVAPLPQGVSGHTAILQPDGRVVAVGGSGYYTQVYDPARDIWTQDVADPITIGGVAAPLRDGRILLAGLRIAALYTAAPADRSCFAETGKCVGGPFLAYWQAHGGLAINGYPISDEQVELLEDGKPYTVQYFERSRFEYHPENYDPQFQVLLGQFGRRTLGAAYGDYISYPGFLEATKPAAPLADARYFPETGHNLGGRFLAYWEANGGLAQFGLPITDERYDGVGTVPGVACCRTQYFERARYEYHPENDGTPYEVLLGQFGRQILADNAKLTGEFGRLYLSEARVRDRLGAPRGPQLAVPGAAQPFEHGLMIWRGDLKRILVLAGTPDGGSVVPGNNGYGGDVTWPDTWQEGQDAGGGAAPVAGRSLPRRGIGKLWREQNLRNSLGYATTPDEQAYTLTIQEFAAGVLLTTDGPGGHNIYAVYLQATGSHGSQRVGDYERFAPR